MRKHDWTQRLSRMASESIGGDYRRALCVVLSCLVFGNTGLAAAEVGASPDMRAAERLSEPALPHLPEALAQQIEQDEQEIDRLLIESDAVDATKAQALITTAEALVQARSQIQGDLWWETIDARQRLAELRGWLALTPGQRAELAQATRLSNQVSVLDRARKYEEALVSARTSLDLLGRVWGEGHLNYAYSLHHLAGLYREQSAFAQAVPLYERALAIMEQTVGYVHPSTAIILNDLALLYQKQGVYPKAVPIFQRALEIREKVLGLEHPDTGSSLNNLGVLYLDQEAYTQARPLLERALTIREQASGPEHLDTATSLNNLASLYYLEGAYARALPLYERVLAIEAKAYDSEHPSLATALNNLAEVYQKQGAFAQALPLHERVLAIREKALGSDHPDTAKSLNNLAMLHQEQGAYTQALLLCERALAINAKVLGPDHPSTILVRKNLERLRLRHHYVISADGAEVADQNTDLVWRRCSEGMYWDGATCTGEAGIYTHADALQLAGSAGVVWRLPSREELRSIVDMDIHLDLVNGVKLAAIDLTIFPNTPTREFWSSTLHRDTRSYGYVEFYDGLSGGSESEEKRFHVRLVRAGLDWEQAGQIRKTQQ
ncbi:MAG: tetratricopeptide repeat protein [Nitrospirota bacterium]|nr:tetratricopeptide repeat protein [Nitrospirota bacterium]